MSASHTPTPTHPHTHSTPSRLPHIYRNKHITHAYPLTPIHLYTKILLYPHMLTQVIINFNTSALRVQFIVRRQRLGALEVLHTYIHTYIHT